MKNIYKPRVEEKMVSFYESLSEKDRRRYAAIEVQKLGHGGQKYISDLLGCDEKTIQKGLSELENQVELKKNE
jgi:hypothetical protein